ncbi:MAG: tetratricopeptide repeat protein [Verrucomicrobia bacterium]|nr:tetratricopeptide repeat protein [Verrucomicrobiota bacterium]
MPNELSQSVPAEQRIAWMPGWTLAPAPDKIIHAVGGLDAVIQCAEPGCLHREGNRDAWQLHLGNPGQPESFTLLYWSASGIKLETPEGEHVLICPEPGILFGEAPVAAPPRLESTSDIERRKAVEEIRGADRNSVLMTRRVVNGKLRFCLTTRGELHHEQLADAQGFLEQDPHQWLADIEGARRAKGLRPSNAAPALALAVEQLYSRLRGNGDGESLFSASDDMPRAVDTRQLLPVINTWCRVDPVIAWTLLLSYLRAVQAGSDLPRWLPIHDPHHPLPDDPVDGMVARALLTCWRAMPNRGSLLSSLEACTSYLTRLTTSDSLPSRFTEPPHCRPPQTGPRNKRDNLIEISLWLGELDALRILQSEAGIAESLKPYPLESTTSALRDRMLSLWCEDRRLFDDRAADQEDLRPGFYQCLPLLDTRLDETYREPMLRLLSPAMLLTRGDLLGWVPREAEAPEAAPPALVHHLLSAVHRPEDRAKVTPLITTVKTAAGSRVQQAAPNPTLWAALLIETEWFDVPLSRQYSNAGPVALWIDRNRFKVTLATIAIIAVMILGLSYLLTSRRSLTNGQLESVNALAVRYYQDGDYETSLAMFSDLLDRKQGVNVKADWRIGNIYFRKGDYDQALRHYDLAVEPPYPPHPESMMNRALTLYQLGRFEEAAEAYKSAADTFDRIFPTIARKARIAQELSEKRIQETAESADAP